MAKKTSSKKKKGIQVRIDEDLKEQAEEIFENVGLDTPTAIRIFFKKVVVTGGIPFNIIDDSYYRYTPKQMREIDEAYEESLDPKNISCTFDSVEDMFEDLEKHKHED